MSLLRFLRHDPTWDIDRVSSSDVGWQSRGRQASFAGYRTDHIGGGELPDKTERLEGTVSSNITGNNAPTAAQIREHYEVEKALAARLRNSTREERKHLYSSLYDEMFRRVPLHPQLQEKQSPEFREHVMPRQLRFLCRFLERDSVFLEVGPGDCSFSFAVAPMVKRVYAAEVSEEVVSKPDQAPPNFALIHSDGLTLPLSQRSVDVAYSNQVMEHIHPEDVSDQLRAIYSVLVAGGVYVCVTPNRLCGPHDVSKYFDAVATGFHLREYTWAELTQLFRQAGFSRVTAYVGGMGLHVPCPIFLLTALERVIEPLPPYVRRTLILKTPLIALLLMIRLVGKK
jgi:SAM-dependent methyltransferase